MSNSGKVGLQIFVHPFVVFSISDHFVRSNVNQIEVANGQSSTSNVYGAIIGKQSGHVITIISTFEFVVDSSGAHFDKSIAHLKKQLCIYSYMMILG